LIPGVPLNVSGLAANLSGDYILSSVTHTIDTEKGFISEISTLPPTPVSHLHRSLATLGIVTKVDDPDRFGRVCVKLPNYNNVETDWLQVLTAGAGIGKGLLAIPDVEDSVLVFFPNGELTQGIVLGGLFGAMQREDFDWGVDDARVKRFSLLTGGGQKMIFDDTAQKLRVENSDGSFIEMSPEKFKLHAQRDLEIEAPGRAIRIKAKTVDFEQG
jgi:phage baseplate assembly protein gpV